MGKKKPPKRNPYTLTAGRIDDEEDEEEALSSMLHQFKGEIMLDNMRSLKRKLETVSNDDDDLDVEQQGTKYSEEEDDSDDDGDPDGVDLGTRACWGRHKSRYYVGGDEKEYEPEELAAAIREAEKFDPPRSTDGIQWLGNFYRVFKRQRANCAEDDEDNASLWSLHSSDLEWSDSEKSKHAHNESGGNSITAKCVLEPVRSDEDEEDEEDMADPKASSKEPKRRPITREMEANRGLVPRRRKDQRNPRVKHRNKYRKALVKHYSQVPKLKREDERYSGEKNGIRCGLIRSRKFNY